MFSGKHKHQLVGALLLTALSTTTILWGCQSFSQAKPTLIATQAQSLPITAQAHIGETLIDLEVARTIPEQSKGLMYRTELEANRGMLFPFKPPQPVSFWMKNCLIALDIIFIYQEQVIGIAANTPPCETMPCPTYASGGIVDTVLELRAGRAAELGLKVGDRIPFKPLPVPDQTGKP